MVPVPSTARFLTTVPSGRLVGFVGEASSARLDEERTYPIIAELVQVGKADDSVPQVQQPHYHQQLGKRLVHQGSPSAR